MAQRWSFEEDYIVCKYCVEQEGYRWLGDKEVAEMMDRLHAAGFTARSEKIVLRRAKQYQELICTGESRYATQQVRDIAELYSRQMQEYRLAIKREIKANYELEEIAIETIAEAQALLSLSQCPSALTAYLHTIDFNQTFPMVLQKYLDLKGLKNRDVYRKIYMKADTFSSILRGRNHAVKKENVLRLCVGLQLTVKEAEELLASAGYLFSNAIITDVVVKACLEHKIYSPTYIDVELYDNQAPVLFAL
jgi:hypothetical protein